MFKFDQRESPSLRKMPEHAIGSFDMAGAEPKLTNLELARKDSQFIFSSEAALCYAARLVIDAIGDDAAQYATNRATLLQTEGDVMAASAWRRVAPMVEKLLRDRWVTEPLT
jgi:hypothetical protein